MKYIRFIFFAALLCAAILSAGSCAKECEHNFIDGKCTKCEAPDPNYTATPEHTVEYELLADGTYMLTAYSSNTDEGIVQVPETYNGRLVSAIGKEVFAEAKKKAFYIPYSIKRIGEDAFLYDFTDGQFHVNIYYGGTITEWMKIDFESPYANPLALSLSHLYIKDDGVYSELTSLTVPSEITDIKDNAFYNAAYITEITIPEGVVSIGHNAFAGTSAPEIHLPSTLKYIGDRAFAFTNFPSVKIPASVRFLGAQVFQGLNNTLENVVIEGGGEWQEITGRTNAKHIFEAIEAGAYTSAAPSGGVSLVYQDGLPDYTNLCTRPAQSDFLGFIRVN